jgi:hypothetical protein
MGSSIAAVPAGNRSIDIENKTKNQDGFILALHIYGRIL